MHADSHTQCTDELFVGYAPLAYFILGVMEIFCSTFVGCVILKNNFQPNNSTSTINFLLPVYLGVVLFLVGLGLLMGVDRVVGIYPTNLWLSLFRWWVIRGCTEGLSIFFQRPGIGFQSVRFSIFTGFLWSALSVGLLGLTLAVFGFAPFVILAAVVASLLLLYYLVMWRAPSSRLHRRPAGAAMARLNATILLAQVGAIVGYVGSEGRTNASCAVELMFSLAEFAQLCVMLYAFLLDSMFWQGLYSDEDTNLNLPMLGMWDMNDTDTVRMVTQSIAHLERRVVYIIPFSHLRVDTSKFFSGGSARVYRGEYQGLEVAIKFLFCMELTPGRVVEFCAEATLLNSLEHENIVSCHGVAIMPPAISLVTEFCTYGSLFDFLHSFDWMVTERVDGSLSSPPSPSSSSTNTSAHGTASGRRRASSEREAQLQRERDRDMETPPASPRSKRGAYMSPVQQLL
ncbi:hypothetical protein B484DRAFT_398080, partial [Ochromonadaceae sp. CCMP2298]